MALIETAQAVKAGRQSAIENLEKYLQAIAKIPDLNAFINVLETSARRKAEEIDTKVKKGGQSGPLAGLVIAVKDNINIKDTPTTCASKILESFISPYHATVIEKLNQADAIIIGKTNMDEFAMGSSNENSAFGPVKNPVNNSKVSGGSSGGSAVAVAAGLADAALGSDTGGSIRQPASFTGTVGIKPSYGRVSRFGLVAFASSLDQIGVFAKTSRDAAYVLQQIAGHDANDSTSADRTVPDYNNSFIEDVKGLKIGLPKEYFSVGLDSEIKSSVLNCAEKLKENGAEIIDLSLSTTEYAIAIYYIIATAEASSNLSRFDGVRYGLRRAQDEGLLEMYGKTRSAGFGDEVQRRILLGTYVLSAGYYDAYYKKAQQVRRLLKNDFDAAFKKCDLILSPTTPTTAFNIGENSNDPLAMYLQDIYTVSANLAGICGINIPLGNHSNGLPMGLQLQANAFDEPILFRAGNFIEKMIR